MQLSPSSCSKTSQNFQWRGLSIEDFFDNVECEDVRREVLLKMYPERGNFTASYWYKMLQSFRFYNIAYSFSPSHFLWLVFYVHRSQKRRLVFPEQQPTSVSSKTCFDQIFKRRVPSKSIRLDINWGGVVGGMMGGVQFHALADY